MLCIVAITLRFIICTSSIDTLMVKNLLWCIKMVKVRHDGQYLDTIASVCED